MTFNWLGEREHEIVSLITVSLSHPMGSVRLLTAGMAGIVVQTTDTTGHAHEYFLPWHEVRRIERLDTTLQPKEIDHATNTVNDSQESAD